MKFNTSNLLQSVSSWEELRRFVSGALTNLSQILTNNVTFADNVKCQIVTVQIGTSETTVSHNLGVVPLGYIVIGCDQLAEVKFGSTAFTNKSIYLISSTTATYTLIILGG